MPATDHDTSLAEQVLADAPYVNLCRERLDDRCLTTVSAQEAWENLVLPLRVERGTHVFATTVETLTNAIELIQERIASPFRVVLTEVRPLEQFIAERYGYEGVE